MIITIPLRQPIFDTEIFPANKRLDRLPFLHRAKNAPVEFLHSTDRKTSADVFLLSSSGELPVPCEFSLFGFALFVHAPELMRQKLLEKCLFQFRFCGNRTYLEIPAHFLPSCPLDTTGRPARDQADRIKQAFKDVYDFTNHGSTLRIRPAELFSMELLWPDGVEIPEPVRITAYMDGLLWMPL